MFGTDCAGIENFHRFSPISGLPLPGDCCVKATTQGHAKQRLDPKIAGPFLKRTWIRHLENAVSDFIES
ncbi:hypothetical protein FGK64_09050 [Arenibacterium halophilum]|uniref:Uncharacterized protein n=1 Tax=Arenibacterium halophilum TaxID=2583821 RepID=A0ABY2XAB1_9RHOB|nr:hypothetical protein FGK64_09050 [Arenibacterium halophilum]